VRWRELGVAPFLDAHVIRVYPPNHLTLAESRARALADTEAAPGEPPDDTALAAYVRTYFARYRAVIERFFEPLAPALPLYASAPFASVVVRFGRGVIIGHRPAPTESVRVMRFDELDPPLEPGWTIFTLQDQLDVPALSFDFTPRPYDARQAEVEGTRQALHDALSIFWQLIDEGQYASLCRELLRLQGVELDSDIAVDDRAFGAVADVLLQEPAGFRREERWAFDFKPHQTERVSARYVKELEDYLAQTTAGVDVVCVLRSGDLTSIGNHIAVGNPRIRLWDRAVLDRLIHAHFDLLSSVFTHYASAVATVSDELGLGGAPASRLAEFEGRLRACDCGNEHFAHYEALGTEIFQYLFPSNSARRKSSTERATERSAATSCSATNARTSSSSVSRNGSPPISSSSTSRTTRTPSGDPSCRTWRSTPTRPSAGWSASSLGMAPRRRRLPFRSGSTATPIRWCSC